MCVCVCERERERGERGREGAVNNQFVNIERV